MEIIQKHNSGLQMEQNAIYLTKIGSVLRKLQLFKDPNSNFYRYFAGLTEFYIKVHNQQKHPSSAKMHFPDSETYRNKNIMV